MTCETWTLTLCLILCACDLDPPSAPPAIDCTSDRAALRYPDACGDAGSDGESDSGGDQRDREVDD